MQRGEGHHQQHLRKITGRGEQLEGSRRWEGAESNVEGRGLSRVRESQAQRRPVSEKISRAQRGNRHCYHSRLGGFAALRNVGLAQGWAVTAFPPEDRGSEGRLTRLTRPSPPGSQKKAGLYTSLALTSLRLPSTSETCTPVSNPPHSFTHSWGS